MRPLSKVKTRRDGSLPLFVFFVSTRGFRCFHVFSAIFLNLTTATTWSSRITVPLPPLVYAVIETYDFATRETNMFQTFGNYNWYNLLSSKCNHRLRNTLMVNKELI